MLDPASVETPAAAPPAPAPPARDEAKPNPPASDAPADIFGRISQFFTATPTAVEAKEPISPPPPARIDRTPDMRPPAYGFFTRLIRTYTEDGSEIAHAGDAPSTQGQMLRDVPLAIDDNLTLGMNLPATAGGEDATCFDKDNDGGHFCLMTPSWPPGPAAAVDRTTELPSVGLAAVRFDLGKASHIQLRFVGDGFEQVVAFFTQLYGPPTERSVRRTASVSENPIVLWRSVDSNSGNISTLEIRRYDDLLPNGMESRVGVVRAYRDNSASLFPPLTSDDIAVVP
jgi:hypothetical protein